MPYAMRGQTDSSFPRMPPCLPDSTVVEGGIKPALYPALAGRVSACTCKNVLGHLEENLNTPAFAVDANYLIIRQFGVCGKERQPFLLGSPVSDEYDLGRYLFTAFELANADSYGCEDLGPAPLFPGSGIQLIQSHLLPLIVVINLRH